MTIKHVFAAVGMVALIGVMVPIAGPMSALGQSASGSTSGCGASCGGGGPTSSTPPDNGSPNGGPGGGPGMPTPPTKQDVSQLEQLCNASLNKLAKVPEKLVIAFGNEAGVSVVPLCNSGAGHQAKIDNSQALPLQKAIANNAALMAALKAHGFHAEDVVGVILVEGVATLYVHRGAA